MIRMGRNSRDEATEGKDYQTQLSGDPANRYTSDTQPSSTRAISESDSMARDIKEGRLSGFVGHGTTLSGETTFEAMLRVDGHLIGTVTSDTGTLIIGTNGQVDANIAVAAAMIGGTVNGDILVTEKLQLGRTARVMGNIQAPRLVIEEGAILEGSCSMMRAMETHDKANASQAVDAEEDEAPAYSSAYTNLSATDDQASLLEVDDEELEAAETARA